MTQDEYDTIQEYYQKGQFQDYEKELEMDTCVDLSDFDPTVPMPEPPPVDPDEQYPFDDNDCGDFDPDYYLPDGEYDQ